ncbi:MAG: glycoside hydrolase family 9 protein [Acidobacteriia bacterium]|nr:glycoside hydrolase family 9 protein [Terriglobia bacterium]
MFRRIAFSLLSAFIVLAAPMAAANEGITLNEQEYFSGPGFSFLLFHNNYQVGYQGGLQMILNDERVLDSGDLFLQPKHGQPRPELRVLRREVDRAHSQATVFGEIEGWSSGYQLKVGSDGDSIFITLKLDHPLDWSKIEQAGLKINLYPGTYLSKSYQGDGGFGVFPEQYGGKTVLYGPAKMVNVAQEEPLHNFTISRQDGVLVLIDTRQGGPESWFMFAAPFAPGSQATEIGLTITPRLTPSWRRAPVIGISQVGYLPRQPKRAILEMDARDSAVEPISLYQLQSTGEKKLVKSEVPKAWGKFLRFQYAIFDFSEVQQPGVYLLEFRGQEAGPFQIAEAVADEAWQPTLEYFLPIQMCHVAVKEGLRTWHGPCHLDDALQAPAHKMWIDGYQQGEHETKYADNEHIPGLDWGGWHDAGDFDLPAGSIADTTLGLALAQEEFHPSLDETSIRRSEREVLLHQKDGKQDLLQQIEFGAESMLASYRIAGHIFPGIIESSEQGYNYLGDPVNITDNRIYDAKLKPSAVEGMHSGKLDDRWVFTNRNTGLQYEVAQSLAAASRVLRGYNDALADESLKTAEQLWQYEQTHAPDFAPNSYAPRNDGGFHSQELAATAELLITTGEAEYRDRLIALLPILQGISGEQFGTGPGWVLARALSKLDNSEFKSVIREVAEKWKIVADQRAATNPWGVHYPPQVSNPEYKLETRSGIHSSFVWGEGWRLQEDALHHYYLHKVFPDLFGAAPVFGTVDFVLGAHPANNRSFVSGVGAESALAAYGFNRADWSNIPGGVISGASLIKPDYMELKKFPFLWYQTEYVIGGAATYIFDVLATQKLASQ